MPNNTLGAPASVTLAVMLLASALLAQPAPSASVSQHVGATAVASASALPDRLPYDGGVVPKGYSVESYPHYGTMIAGGAIAGIGAGIAAYFSTRYTDTSKCAPGDGDSCDEKNRKVLSSQIRGFVLAGAGLAMAIVGLVWQKEYLVKNRTTTLRDSRKPPVFFYLGPQSPSHLGVELSVVF